MLRSSLLKHSVPTIFGPLRYHAFHTTPSAYTAMKSATMSAVVTTPLVSSDSPNSSKVKAHHNSQGRGGFINPWPSYLERGAGEMFRKMGSRWISGKCTRGPAMTYTGLPGALL